MSHLPQPRPKKGLLLAGDYPRGPRGRCASLLLEAALPDLPADHRPQASWDFGRSQGAGLLFPLTPKAYTHGGSSASLLTWEAELFQGR